MTAPAADPRLAELTEALIASGLMQRLRVYFEGYASHTGTLAVATTEAELAANWALNILALLPARTVTTEAEALVPRLVEALQEWMEYGDTPSTRDGTRSVLAAALAAAGGSDDH